MNTRFIKMLKQVEELLQRASNQEADWSSKDESYQWIEATFRHFRCCHPNKSEKGTIKQHLLIASGYSRAQITQLVVQRIPRQRLPEAQAAHSQWIFILVCQTRYPASGRGRPASQRAKWASDQEDL